MLKNVADQQYFNLLNYIMENGVDRADRTGTGTRSIFGYQMRFDISERFPLLTTKKIHTKSIIHELLWMIAGDTNVKYLRDNGVTIWDEWTKPDGTIGKGYGYQWRNFGGKEATGQALGYEWVDQPEVKGIDQLKDVIDRIQSRPEDRRLIVSAWNPVDIPDMALPPCHVLYQFYVANGKLSCQLYQRSCDTFLGLPFNIAGYSLLVYMVAQVTGLKPGEFIWTGGDVHIYSNHFEQVKEQLTRVPFDSPTLKLNPKVKSLFDFKYEDIIIEGYQSHGTIKAPIAV